MSLSRRDECIEFCLRVCIAYVCIALSAAYVHLDFAFAAVWEWSSDSRAVAAVVAILVASASMELWLEYDQQLVRWIKRAIRSEDRHG